MARGEEGNENGRVGRAEREAEPERAFRQSTQHSPSSPPPITNNRPLDHFHQQFSWNLFPFFALLQRINTLSFSGPLPAGYLSLSLKFGPFSILLITDQNEHAPIAFRGPEHDQSVGQIIHSHSGLLSPPPLSPGKSICPDGPARTLRWTVWIGGATVCAGRSRR